MLPAQTSQARILVADGNVARLRHLVALLRSGGHCLHVARSGVDTVAIAQEVLPDIIVLGLTLPDMDGLAVGRALHTQRDTRRIPVVIIGKDRTLGDMQQAFETGAADFLFPPVSEVELNARIRTHVETNRLRRELGSRIAELEILYADMRDTAFRDPLTGLFNRRFMEQRLDLHAAENDNVLLALFDIDFFKQVNDSCSHAVGDAVLLEIARLARNAFDHRGSVARWGGDEFLAAFQDSDAARALRICERFRSAVARTDWEALGVDRAVTVSIGLAPLRSSIDDSLDRADRALYAAKGKGRNKVSYRGEDALDERDVVDAA